MKTCRITALATSHVSSHVSHISLSNHLTDCGVQSESSYTIRLCIITHSDSYSLHPPAFTRINLYTFSFVFYVCEHLLDLILIICY